MPELKEAPLFKHNPKRFVMFPIQHPDLWDFYKKQEHVFWTAEEITFLSDLTDWRTRLSEQEQHFIKMVLAFFAASDGIVNENLALSFLTEVQLPEARAFYTAQALIETIHSEVYSLLIETYIQDPEEKDKLFNAIEHFPIIKKKADWALKWMGTDNFVKKLLAFACVEGLFFSASFSAIFWLKERNLMKEALGFSNELISRDEALHCDFACHLYKNYIPQEHKLPEEEVYALVADALTLEKEFACDAISVDLIGMNKDLMSDYLEFVADGLLQNMGLAKRYKKENPLPFMARIAINTKSNFFETRVGQYEKANMQSSEDPFSNLYDGSF